MLTHPSTNFKIQRYYRKMNIKLMVFKINLSKTIMDGENATNVDEYANIETCWFVIYVKNLEVTYFDSFDVKHIPKN